ncbi:hypothetical protein I3843_10G001300 [Carya illinoinensis]|uniref:Uncharacterized protein n=1 Tax=Carya illinoinensis TaxID=32201 RepID=A0A8T1P6W7_CARIL|nr:uncharacterized protein LOC122279043 [Carya illinoinensis]XP_042945269.1 uncharacterized protein LOC122279043 [Carya illinoinensis]XP_042945270.1 uncharacterized protein LOC122279043 [Carya illinoinensis]XP_042945271.1 uncharacterized protein LOC122279043 [Carya illinoinensis]XP_042945272.1 uncharacterized protein LOC122279043 [Carya illinoinensis]XP_042945273.1 uncharacterized protein LOC122279043 [Carya illinoinensis]XP_042945274.1 uncharacterized protein LOC122279043 [Carya illinoinensi
METGERNTTTCKPLEPELFLQWGNRKRVRCVRVKDPEISARLNGGIRRKITSSFASEKESFHLQPNRLSRSTEGSTLRKSASLEKERYYSTRGSVIVEENGKVSVDVNNNGIGEERGLALPKLYITLSSKEKEEDFMAMKGCKPPQRPKKRAKIIQRSVLLVSPGAWLTDMCHERYEVREKKNSKKRSRGLKSMGSMDSDSE